MHKIETVVEARLWKTHSASRPPCQNGCKFPDSIAIKINFEIIKGRNRIKLSCHSHILGNNKKSNILQEPIPPTFLLAYSNITLIKLSMSYQGFATSPPAFISVPTLRRIFFKTDSFWLFFFFYCGHFVCAWRFISNFEAITQRKRCAHDGPPYKLRKKNKKPSEIWDYNGFNKYSYH